MTRTSGFRPLTRPTRRRVGAALVLALTVAAALGQEPPPEPHRFRESVEVHEVRLEVRVENGLGLEIEGLTAEDFSVAEDGKPVEIVSFRVLNSRAQRTAPSPGATEVQEQQAETDPTVAPGPRPQETVVLLFDFSDSRFNFLRSIENVRRWADENPERVRERTWQVAILDDSVGILDAPTRDPETLRSTLAELKKRKNQRTRVWRFIPSPSDSAWVKKAREYNAVAQRPVARAGIATATGEDEQLKRFRRSDCRQASQWVIGQTSQLSQLIESLAPVPGRKTVVWFHGTSISSAPEDCPPKDVFEAVRSSWELGALAAASGVVLHSSDSSGLVLRYGGPESGASDLGIIGEYMETGSASSGYEHFLTLGALSRNLSIHTGGHRVALNDQSYVFERAFEEPVYEVIVLVPHGPDGLHHHIKVALEGHPLARLSYPRNYVDLDQRSLLLNQVERFSLLPGSYGSFPVSLRGAGSHQDGGFIAEITIAVPAAQVAAVEEGEQLVVKLEPFIAVFRPDGRLIELRALEVSEVRLDKNQVLGPRDAFRTSSRFELTPGEYLFTGAFFDVLNQTSGITSARLDFTAAAAE